jgi:hypothetical protein
MPHLVARDARRLTRRIHLSIVDPGLTPAIPALIADFAPWFSPGLPGISRLCARSTSMVALSATRRKAWEVAPCPMREADQVRGHIQAVLTVTVTEDLGPLAMYLTVHGFTDVSGGVA